MRNKRVCLPVFFLLLAAVALAAEPYAKIVYAEGSSFQLIRNGKPVKWDVSSPGVFGLEVQPGDVIQTAPSTFLELSIYPIKASVQVAENTSFRCDADSTGTQSSGELYYGRVRAKVAKLAGNSSYRISSPSLVAGVRGTDFGCDVIAIRPSASDEAAAGSPVLNRVFCFEGSVLVATPEADGTPTVLIGPDEMVEKVLVADRTAGAETAAEGKAAEGESGSLEKSPVSGEVREFWGARPVVGLAPAGPPEPVFHMEGDLTVTERPWPEGRQENPSLRNLRIPNLAVAALIGLGSLSCIGTSYWCAEVDSSAILLQQSYSAGWIMIGSGSVLAVISALVR